MTDTDLIGPWVRRFLVEHLVGERNLSRNTQASYRDTLVQLLPFVADSASVSIECLTSKHLTADALRLFLSHVEGERHFLVWRHLLRTIQKGCQASHELLRKARDGRTSRCSGS